MLDGIEPGVIDEIYHAAEHVPGARIVEAKARWIGHRLHADVTINVDQSLPLWRRSQIAGTLEDEMFEHMPALAAANIRFSAETADHKHPHPHEHNHEHGAPHTHDH
ncbi:cation transporter dimerization domain-containing protein [Mesorhizobium sp.]|uniref:cation transporter dimerization domain-containing protein n=1 Tax=Mesorhizobium sp. TaxID=1871066 RepID=UPI00257F4BDB|nr:cation transporter dimerization domain-containing protein [Mesorhizobium sp.]